MGYHLFAYTIHDYRFILFYIVCLGQHLRSSQGDLWILMRRCEGGCIILIESSCRAERCCYLRMADSHRPLRIELHQNSRCLPRVRCIFCWKSFQGQRSKVTRKQSWVTIQSYMYCSSRNQLFLIHTSSLQVNFKALDPYELYSTHANMQCRW